jgi:23S rRNA (pseudouridine1915-N3)-methyltransferase
VTFLHVVAVGKLRPCFREAADDYLARLSRYLPIAEREAKEAGRAGNDAAQRREEGKRLTALVPPGCLVVLGRWRDEGRDVALLIGGSTGLDDGLAAAAGHRWSLGALTLPHELARVVVLEQCYRAATILAGQKYHKGK